MVSRSGAGRPCHGGARLCRHLFILSASLRAGISLRSDSQSRSCPHVTSVHCKNNVTEARPHALGMAQIRIPNYAGMTAGEQVRRSRSRVCSWEDPVLASPAPPPRCNLLFARSPGISTMRSAQLAANTMLPPQQCPGGPHGHGAAAKEKQAGKL